MKPEREMEIERLTLEPIYRLPQAQDLATEAELNPLCKGKVDPVRNQQLSGR